MVLYITVRVPLQLEYSTCYNVLDLDIVHVDVLDLRIALVHSTAKCSRIPTVDLPVYVPVPLLVLCISFLFRIRYTSYPDCIDR